MKRRQILGPSKQEVLEIVKQNPTMSGQEIAKQFKCDIARVHHARSELGLAEKRPFKHRAKSTHDSPRVISSLRLQVNQLTEANIELARAAMKTDQGALIAELQAVIRYLEKKLEQANGSSV